MSLDFNTLDLLRQTHPAWRLLNSQHAPLVISFLQRVFIQPNERVISQADLAERLEDGLFALQESLECRCLSQGGAGVPQRLGRQ